MMKVWITKYALTGGIMEAHISKSELRKDCLYKFVDMKLPTGVVDTMVEKVISMKEKNLPSRKQKICDRKKSPV